ncbi:ABC transporter permease [bacterium]|nr:ABC transporter permease [bacterium]
MISRFLMKHFDWFVAWRYLFSRQRKVLVSVITLISIAGVAVGVAALIVVRGVMDGADTMIFRKYADLYPHVRIVDTRGAAQPVDQKLLDELNANPQVVRAEPVYEKKTLYQPVGTAGESIRLINLIGTDRIGKGTPYVLDQKVKQQWTLPPDTIAVGGTLAFDSKVWIDSKVTLTALNPIYTAIGWMFKQTTMPVSMLVSSGFDEYDVCTAFVSRETFRDLYRVKGGADYINVMLKDPFAADSFKSALKTPPHFRVSTWAEENREMFSALKLEKKAMSLILVLVVIVAAFNIIGTLILMVIEKTREIGIMKAIGASPRLIARVFLLDGILIGLIGTAVGLAIGLTLCATIPLIKLPIPAIVAVDHLPIEVDPVAVAIILLSAIVICTLAAVFPAIQAAKLNPVEALSYD